MTNSFIQWPVLSPYRAGVGQAFQPDVLVQAVLGVVPRWRQAGKPDLRRVMLPCVLVASLLAVIGCGPTAKNGAEGSGQSAGEKAPAEAASADAAATGLKVLEDMAAAYQKTPTYADGGEVTMRVKLKGREPVEQKFDFSVTLARPNRILLHAYQSAVVSDGKQVYATMVECPGYVLTYGAPENLTLDNVYTDPMLKDNLENQIAGGLPQMAFLLGEEPLRMVLPEKDPPELLSPQKIGDALCHRVSLKHNDGLLVFWIDQRTHALLRIEYPVDTMRKNFDASSGEVEELSLIAEFTGAQLGGKIDDVAFQFQSPPGAKEIKRFVGPPPPESYKQLGQQVQDFTFTRPDGSAISRQSLTGKVAVIDFWATWAAPCAESLPRLMQVYEKYKDNGQIEFVAVSVDAQEVSAAQLEQKLAEFKVQLPTARDPQQFARTTFGVEGVPNLFILGPDGKLQDNEMGGNPTLVADLPRKLDKLLAGQEIWQESLARYETLMRDYEAAMMQDPPTAAESTGPPPVAIAERSEPATFELKELWSVQQPDLTAPGNILVVQDGNQPPKLLVNDAWRTVVEINTQGKVVAKHDLEIPPSAVVNFLRTAVDAQGRRYFAGSASNQQQVHVWDQDWRRVLSYPEGETAEVADVQMGDLDGDGKLELVVSFWEVVGIQAISLEGQRLWADRSLANVFRLAIVGPEAGRKQVFAANDKGTIAMFRHDGEKISDLVIRDRYVRLIIASDLDGDGRQEFCGIAPTREPNVEVVLGIGPGGEEAWNYALPPGIHQHLFETLTHGKLLPGDSDQWLAAGADGSIHLIAADGKPLDKFNYGAALTGMAVAQVNGQSVLLVSSPEKLTAWGVTPRAGGR